MEGTVFAAVGAASKFIGGKAGQFIGKGVSAAVGAAAKSRGGGGASPQLPPSKANQVRQ